MNLHFREITLIIIWKIETDIKRASGAITIFNYLCLRISEKVDRFTSYLWEQKKTWARMVRAAVRWMTSRFLPSTVDKIDVAVTEQDKKYWREGALKLQMTRTLNCCGTFRWVINGRALTKSKRDFWREGRFWGLHNVNRWSHRVWSDHLSRSCKREEGLGWTLDTPNL